jgi:hypothetical protein
VEVLQNKFGSLAFIDDAGDPGFKFADGSSRHFVIACVVFEDFKQAEAVSGTMRQFRTDRSWNQRYELKFHNLRKDLVREILKEVCRFDFRIRAIAVDKPTVMNHEMRTKPDNFYNYIIKEVLARDEALMNAKIRLDGEQGREYKRQAIAYFRKEVNRGGRKIADFDYADSRGNNLIQLADLVAGSIYRPFLNPLTAFPSSGCKVSGTSFREAIHFEQYLQQSRL